MIQVRVAHDGGRTHIEIRAGNSPATLHTTGTLDMDEFNGDTFLDLLGRHIEVEIVEVDQ